MLSEKLNFRHRKHTETALKSTENSSVRKIAVFCGLGNMLINSYLRNNSFRCFVPRRAKRAVSHSD